MSDTSIEKQDSPEAFCTDFSDELRRRGYSLRRAAELTHWSKSAIGKACTGPGLPNRSLVEDVLTAVGLEGSAVQDWMLRHAELSMAAAHPVEEPVVPAPVVRTGVGRRWIAVVGVVGLLVGGAVTAAVLLLSRPAPAAAPVAVGPVVLTVQNKIALGAADLVEDTGPAYLSSKPISFCSSRGCKIDGTNVVSGALLPATCVAQGEMMWNYNLDSPAGTNPNRAKSDLWYRISWPDGRTGFLSEVYLDPASRGGLGLPACA